MYAATKKTEFDREDIFLSREERESKRLCEYILNQEPVLREYSGMTGFSTVTNRWSVMPSVERGT